MSLTERFIKHLRLTGMIVPGDKLLLAVSGGLDSTVLCALCHQAGLSFSIAHCNFQLRGAESDRDELFVKALASKYEVPFFSRKFDTEDYAQQHKLSIQEAARVLRYNFFDETLEQQPFFQMETKEKHKPNAKLLTAHHKDDNIETLVMHFFRGTGLNGLTGIPAQQGYIRRPLLIFSRKELESFAKEHNISYVEDSSNSSSKYTRNYFRNDWIPALEKVYPQVRENLAGNIERFTEIRKMYQIMVGDLKNKLCTKKGEEVHIPIAQLMKFKNRALIYDIINDYGFTEGHIDELIKLADSESGRFIQSPDNNYRIIKHRHWFIITPQGNNESSTFIIEAGQKQISFGAGKLCLVEDSRPPFTILASAAIASLDLSELEFPLLLRKWKTADYFYPLGMKKKKKLARFFIDQKLSRTEKENTWVIESGKRICWIVGKRIDERFKLRSNTKNVLRIEWINDQTG